jgi:hypothetical protein
VDGRQQVPPCPALVLCSSPAIPGDYAIARFTPSPTPRLSYYVFANDVDVAYGVSEGWRRSEVSGADILQFRDSGTAARVSAAYRQYMVEDFHGVAASRVSRPSVAFASIPCWFPPLPGGSGKGVLVGGDGAGSHRRMDCATYWSVATGGSDRPTTWRVDGASLGWSGGFVNRLVVAVLPPG